MSFFRRYYFDCVEPFCSQVFSSACLVGLAKVLANLGVSQNRLNAEAEAMTLLRGLTDSQLTMALAQIKALGELKD